MSLLDKFLNLFKKKTKIAILKDDTELYKAIKENMDNFEKNATIDNIRVLTVAVKQLVIENQILKEAIINQNQVLHNLVIVNQRIVDMLNTAMTLDIDENYLEDEEDPTEMADEKSNKAATKKFGVN